MRADELPCKQRLSRTSPLTSMNFRLTVSSPGRRLQMPTRTFPSWANTPALKWEAGTFGYEVNTDLAWMGAYPDDSGDAMRIWRIERRLNWFEAPVKTKSACLLGGRAAEARNPWLFIDEALALCRQCARPSTWSVFPVFPAARRSSTTYVTTDVDAALGRPGSLQGCPVRPLFDASHATDLSTTP